MGTYIHYTDEQKERANTVDLVELLRQRGEKLLRSGREYRLENDHSITVRGNKWYDHDSRQGGHPVSFVQYYYGMSYQEAMEFLLNGTYPVAGSRETEPPKPFALPPPHQNMRRVYAYLMKQRQIDGAIITHFARKGLLYGAVSVAWTMGPNTATTRPRWMRNHSSGQSSLPSIPS